MGHLSGARTVVEVAEPGRRPVSTYNHTRGRHHEMSTADAQEAKSGADSNGGGPGVGGDSHRRDGAGVGGGSGSPVKARRAPSTDGAAPPFSSQFRSLGPAGVERRPAGQLSRMEYGCPDDLAATTWRRRSRISGGWAALGGGSSLARSRAATSTDERWAAAVIAELAATLKLARAGIGNTRTEAGV